MTYTLTETQKAYLEHLLDIQEKKIFNNASQLRIQSMIRCGIYNDDDREIMNSINAAYIEWKQTGIIPEYFRFV